jgi:ribonuclease HII
VLAGIDEAGRGSLAGPVVVAAAILPRGCSLPEVRDSKQLSERARERAFLRIREAATTWSAVAVSAQEVDLRNVLHASLWGMERVVQRLRVRPDLVLVDGHLLPPRLDVRALAVVKGDDRSQCIGAASILAKVLRDRLMRAWHRRFPAYGFAHNVGYPTPEHLDALRRLGACPLHRRSFRPVALVESQPELPFLVDRA